MLSTISGDEIASWATRVDAPSVLPDLVRRLILATSRPQSVEFRADGGTRYEGWDGTVICVDSSSAFCPEGNSYWELSTESDVARKLERDYKKRAGDPTATYVAVTARRYPKVANWAEKKRAENKWADVRAYDADRLATWFTEAPAVAVWFASEHLGRPADEVNTLSEFLDAWSNQTSPRLPRELLLLGTERKRATEKVGEWVHGPALRFTLSGDTQADALRFVAAAILSLPDGNELAARALVLRSERALRWAERQRRPLILVPTLDAYGLLTATHHHVAIATDREGAKRQPLDVGLVPFGLLEPVLLRTGGKDSATLARDSGGSLPALVRLCGAPGKPDWAILPQRITLGFLLAGSWSAREDGDMSAVVALTDSTVADIETACIRLSRCPDPPLRQHHDMFGRPTWRWSSPKDAWSTLAPDLNDSILDTFSNIALGVLGEESQVFTLSKEDRPAARLHGKAPTRSDTLRQGLARSIARISLSNELLSGTTRNGSRMAGAIVRTLLKPKWIAWASLADVLPQLAEAAPDEFLDALSRSLDHGPEGVGHLFLEAALFSSPHTGLMFALTRLGWSASRMPRVARALARLMEKDPGGNLSPRPVTCLGRLLNPFRPATNADVDERIAALKLLHVHNSDAAWLLTQKLAAKLFSTTASPAQTPEFLPEPCEERTVSGAELQRFGTAIGNLLLEHAGTSAERWCQLVKAYRHCQGLRKNFFDLLEEQIRSGVVTDPDQKIWNELRGALHLSYIRRPTARDQDVEQLERLYSILTPDDPVGASAWLFDPAVRIPEHFSNGWREEQDRIGELRRAAVVRLFEQDGIASLRALAAAVRDPFDLGVALAHSPIAKDVETLVLDLKDETLGSTRPGYFAVLAQRRGSAWSAQHLRDLMAHGRPEEATHCARVLPRTPETWDTLEGIAPALKEAYWRSKPTLYPQDAADADRTINELVAVREYAEGFEVAGHHAKSIPSNTLVNLLDALSKTPAELERAANSDWGAQKIFERLGADKSVDDDALAGLELRFLQWICEPGGKAPDGLRLFKAIEKSPELFAKLVEIIYRPDPPSEPDPANEEQEDQIEESDRIAAQNAYHVLQAWDGYPGQYLEGDDRTLRLAEWSRTVLALTEQSRRVAMGEAALADVLARVGAGQDGIWPCETARDLIEENRQYFRRELRVAKGNRRGIYSKAVFEGGGQEQAIAVQYRKDAASLRMSGRYPETAALLESIAETYQNDARGQDYAARDGRLEAGVDEGS